MIKSQPATFRNFHMYWNELSITGNFTEADRTACLALWLECDTAADAEATVEAMLRGAK